MIKTTVYVLCTSKDIIVYSMYSTHLYMYTAYSCTHMYLSGLHSCGVYVPIYPCDGFIYIHNELFIQKYAKCGSLLIDTRTDAGFSLLYKHALDTDLLSCSIEAMLQDSRRNFFTKMIELL